MRSIASAQLQFLDFLYVVSSKKGAPSPPLHGPSGLCGTLNYYAIIKNNNRLYLGNFFIKDMVFKKDLKTRYIL